MQQRAANIACAAPMALIMASESFKIEGLEGVLKTLQELPPEIVSKRGGPVRSALRKAAVLMQKEAQANIQKIIDTPNIGGENTSTGLLKKSIIVKRTKPPTGKNGERFIVAIKQRVIYPGQAADVKNKTTATQVGRLLEYGTEKRQPMPWLRPAFDAKKVEAVTIFSDTLKKRLDGIVKKLAQQNGVKT